MDSEIALEPENSSLLSLLCHRSRDVALNPLKAGLEFTFFLVCLPVYSSCVYFVLSCGEFKVLNAQSPSLTKKIHSFWEKWASGTEICHWYETPHLLQGDMKRTMLTRQDVR